MLTQYHLTLDVWRLIFDLLAIRDLKNFCLVSQAFNLIATPLLYRSIHLIEWQDPCPVRRPRFKEYDEEQPPLKGHALLLSRLGDDRNDALRALVQEVNISYPAGSFSQDSVHRLQTDDYLIKLIARLPNLRRITLAIPKLQSDLLAHTICNHPAKPELLLLRQSGESETCTFADQTLPCVSTLSANVNPYIKPKDPTRRLLTIQQLFFNCPNLRSFSLEVSGIYGGCVILAPRHDRVTSFQLTGEETFPPLQHLSFDGYCIGDQEWEYWRDGVQWERLSSLAVGPDTTTGVLGRLAGYATRLTTLKVSAWAGDSFPDMAGLDELLLSFNSLETLELKGHRCSIEAIANHRNLSTLCLHEDELAHSQAQRRAPTAQELEHLDLHCPNLKSLKVCVNRGENQWPDYILHHLAKGFKNLRDLSIHFELGLADIKNPIKPTINYKSVQALGDNFFEQRKQSGIEVSQLFTLTLWTGKYFRRYPQWQPSFSKFEDRYTATYKLRLHCDKVIVRHLQKERLDSIWRGEINVSKYDHKFLCDNLEAAVEGPKDDDRSFGYGFGFGALSV
ncbi:hypothetical protein BO94DRAFT_496394 [Aspergillus sclerotioniger CBS 115572]|uniref:F-box domain-containing protein n=1 Tax=Aspergillus sclerotioniger CBS 115572 TaxID=1450535 RepID=A0A317W2M4_9EURO|nr:hypothetical protein BO94DRAFT_496394 [Aspergillus sclerotioniger CBS 115572]PWY80844.1 hypothetical protein BO94DRAFT_496394 [Aspergillus sclerotioniger CBS 115572]